LNGKSLIKQELPKLKKLSFVSKVELISGAIQYVNAPVKITWDNNQYELGEFLVQINGNGVKIRNLKAKKKDGTNEYYHHPHSRYTANLESFPTICLGTFRGKINELLYNCKLKELVILINIYLSSYNRGSRYTSLSDCLGKDIKDTSD
jgi:hypothetical protein